MNADELFICVYLWLNYSILMLSGRPYILVDKSKTNTELSLTRALASLPALFINVNKSPNEPAVATYNKIINPVKLAKVYF